MRLWNELSGNERRFSRLRIPFRDAAIFLADKVAIDFARLGARLNRLVKKSVGSYIRALRLKPGCFSALCGTSELVPSRILHV